MAPEIRMRAITALHQALFARVGPTHRRNYNG